jgi:uncharacterized membrane protein YfcA
MFLLALALDWPSLLGYFSSLLIGISLGLIGGGGSILTLPVLVYLFGVDPVIATAYSLFIVGLTSAVGVIPKYREGMVDLRTALIFGAPSILTVFVTRKWILPSIPAVLWEYEGWILTKSLLLLFLFAVLMIAASYSMIRGKSQNSSHTEQGFKYGPMLAEGAVVGLLTGLVGAGGGFLIIPALVLLTGLPMKKAVGTSLLIIAAKSLIGFTGDLSEHSMDWMLLGIVSAMAVMGIFIGNRLSRQIDGNSLKKGFGWFVLAMGIYILLKEGLGAAH